MPLSSIGPADQQVIQSTSASIHSSTATDSHHPNSDRSKAFHDHFDIPDDDPAHGSPGHINLFSHYKQALAILEWYEKFETAKKKDMNNLPSILHSFKLVDVGCASMSKSAHY